jgi:hypothetical protein
MLIIVIGKLSAFSLGASVIGPGKRSTPRFVRVLDKDALLRIEATINATPLLLVLVAVATVVVVTTSRVFSYSSPLLHVLVFFSRADYSWIGRTLLSWPRSPAFFSPPPPQRPLSSAHSLSSLYLYPLKVLLLSLCALNFSWYLSWLRGVYALAPWRATLRLVRGISFVVTHIHARTHTHTRARTHTHTYLYFVALLAHYEQARIKFA